MMPTRRITRGLDVQAVVDPIDDDLRLSLRLHVRSHDAEGHPRSAAHGGESGDDGLKRAFAGLVGVRVSIDERKKLAPALKHEAQTVGDQARAQSPIVGLDHRYHQPARVGDRQVGGIAAVRSLVAKPARAHPIRPDQLCPLGCVGLGIQPRGRNVGEIRVRIVAGAVLVGQSLGLRLRVNRLGGLEAHRAQIEILQDVEHLKGRQPLRIGPHRIDIDAAVGADQRVDPFAPVRLEVLERQPAADALEVSVDGAGDVAFVERVAAAFADRAVGASEIRIAEQISLARRVTCGRIRAHRIRPLLHARPRLAEHLEIPLPVMGDDLRHRHAALAHRDRRLEKLAPFQAPEALVHGPPRVQRAGRGHGDRTVGRDQPAGRTAANRVEAQRLGRAAGARKARDFRDARIPDQRVTIAAEPGPRGFQESETCGRGHRSVGRAAAALQDVDRGHRGIGMCGARRAGATVDG